MTNGRNATTVLATGGAGYVGAHVAAELLGNGFDVVVLDDFSNAHPGVVERLERLGNGRRVTLVRGDVRDAARLDRVFSEHPIGAVIHLAGLKAVGESVELPELYYDVNIGGAARLLAAMARRGVNRLVFSSSATVYGDPESVPITEDAPLRPTNPYGRTKHMIELLLADAAAARPEMQVVALRYFNPVGAHESGTIGEDPSGVPNNLFPLVAQTAVGRRSHIKLFGHDYPTPDGTCIRDYIHVADLASGHVAAVNALLNTDLAKGSALPINLGTGRGVSVLEALAAFEAASGRPIRRVSAPRRPGDVAVSVADAGRAAALLGWRAERGLDSMCRDTWRWQSRNPHGYAGGEPAAESAAVTAASVVPGLRRSASPA
jgi:UDP-glucose 4-epimerase